MLGSGVATKEAVERERNLRRMMTQGARGVLRLHDPDTRGFYQMFSEKILFGRASGFNAGAGRDSRKFT